MDSIKYCATTPKSSIGRGHWPIGPCTLARGLTTTRRVGTGDFRRQIFGNQSADGIVSSFCIRNKEGEKKIGQKRKEGERGAQREKDRITFLTTAVQARRPWWSAGRQH